MLKRLESHHPGKIRIWTGLDRSWLYEIYHFLAANKDEAADEQGGEIDTPPHSHARLERAALKEGQWFTARRQEKLMDIRVRGCSTRSHATHDKEVRTTRKVSTASRGRQCPELRGRVSFWNTRALFVLSLMTSSQLMEEDEIAVCGVASAASVLLKRGHGSQLGRKRPLSSWLILLRVNAGTGHLCGLTVHLCFCLGVHRKSVNDGSGKSGPGWKRIQCAVLVLQTFAWFFPFFFASFKPERGPCRPRPVR